MSAIVARLRALSSREAGENTRRLLKGLASVGPYFILARALTALAQVAAGRWLGPSEFGLVTLILAASGVLVVLLQQSFSWAVVKFAAMEKTDEGRRAVVSTNFWLQILWTGACGLLLFLLRRPAAAALRLPPPLYPWCLAYTGVLVFYTFVSSALQGVLLFDARGKVEFLYGASALALFAAACRVFPRGFADFIGAMDAALILAGAACLYALRGYLSFDLSRRAAADGAAYLLPNFVSSCGGVVIQSALPLILASYMAPREIGYFGAYEMGTIGVMMVVVNVVVSVLAPLASRPEKQRGVWKKFFLLALPAAAGLFAFFCASEFVILKLIGRGYPVDPAWVAVFSAAAVADFFFFCAVNLVILRDAAGAWYALVGNYLASAGAVAASLWAVPRYGIVGAALALAIGYAAGFAWSASWGWARVRADE